MYFKVFLNVNVQNGDILGGIGKISNIFGSARYP